jgi:hypothetical protein
MRHVASAAAELRQLGIDEDEIELGRSSAAVGAEPGARAVDFQTQRTEMPCFAEVEAG